MSEQFPAQFHDTQYLDLVEYVLSHGVRKTSRTGVNTLSVFAQELRFDLSDWTIPLLTTKKVHTKSIIHELLWMISGDTNIKYLNDNGVTIWDEWADANGDLGPVYGKQWRAWNKYVWIPGGGEGYEWTEGRFSERQVDQLQNVIDMLKTNPDDRRMIVSAWNVGELNQMELPPCHYSFQFWYNNDKKQLSMIVNQRSCDIGLGVPFNIVQYSMLLRLVCNICNMKPGELVWRGGDCHIYENHVEQLKLQMTRAPYPSPNLFITAEPNSIDNFKYEDFLITNYTSHPAIKMEVAV